MPFYVYHCQDVKDREQAAAIRREQLSAHLAYVKKHIDAYAVAGPNREVAGDYRSSTFVVKESSLAGADALMVGDPYVQAGLYRSYNGVEFVPVAGEWVGGVAWE